MTTLAKQSVTTKSYRMVAVPLLLSLLTACAVQVTFMGLKPEYPEYPESYIWLVGNPYDNVVLEVDSLQPTLKWESFPRPQKLPPGGEKLPDRISNVTYELILKKASELVYERNGLSVPYHKIETPLQPSTRYLWTIRARFDLDGKPRVTAWGEMAILVRDISNRPAINVPFPFITPEAERIRTGRGHGGILGDTRR